MNSNISRDRTPVEAFIYQLTGRHHLNLWCSGPGKAKEIGDDTQGSVDLLIDYIQIFQDVFISIRKDHLQEIDSVAHHSEGVSQLVADASRELAEDGKLLIPELLLFRQLSRGDIFVCSQHSDYLVVCVANRYLGGRQPVPFAVRGILDLLIVQSGFARGNDFKIVPTIQVGLRAPDLTVIVGPDQLLRIPVARILRK